jgi:hypothetical protein
MEIDKKRLHEFIFWLWDIIEKRELELTAHGVALMLLGSSGAIPQKELDELLKRAKENPPPLLVARHKEARETLERLLNEENPENALLKFLQEWKPNGPIQ